MTNIIIYSTKPQPELEAVLMDVDDAEVKSVDIAQIKEYAVLNPSLMIVENIDLVKDALMTNKFSCPILFFGPVRKDVTVRAEGYDFISDSKNTDSFKSRICKHYLFL